MEAVHSAIVLGRVADESRWVSVGCVRRAWGLAFCCFEKVHGWRSGIPAHRAHLWPFRLKHLRATMIVVEKGWLRLCRNVAGTQVFWHRGTGEMVHLPMSSQASVLVEDEGSGAFFLHSPSNVETPFRWAREVFTCSLQRSDTDELFIVRATGAPQKREEVLDEGRVARVFGAEGVFEFRAEIFTQPVSDVTCHWWALPHLAVRVLVKMPHPNWLARQFPLYRQAGVEMGVPATHWRTSLTSEFAKAIRHGKEVQSSVLDCSDDEFTVSTAALLVVLCRLAFSARRHERSEHVPEGLLSRCTMAIEALVRTVCSEQKTELKLSGVNGESLGILTVEVFSSHSRVGFSSTGTRAANFDAQFVGGRSIEETLLGLSSSAWQPSLMARFGALKRQWILQAWISLALFLQDSLDVCRDSANFWSRYNHLDLEILEGEHGKARRIPKGFKRAVSAEVKTNKCLRTVQSFLAARNSEKFRGQRNSTRARGTLSAPSGSEFCVDNMFQYMQTGRKIFTAPSTKHLSLGLDATPVGRFDPMLICNWSVEKNIGAWLPLQVASALWKYFFTSSPRTLSPTPVPVQEPPVPPLPKPVKLDL